MFGPSIVSIRRSSPLSRAWRLGAGLLCWSLALPAIAEPPTPPPATTREAQMERVERARLRGDEAALASLRSELSAALATSPSSETRYDLAYTVWRRQLLFREERARVKERDAHLSFAREQLETLLADEPDHLEAKVLLAAVVGGQAGASAFAGMRLGRHAHTLTGQALAAGPDHPRARLQHGILLFFTPGLFGGGAEAALPELERARSALAKQPAEAVWPNWGEVDAAAWVGQSLAALGRRDEARAVYREALAREPDAAWIRDQLLPALADE